MKTAVINNISKLDENGLLNTFIEDNFKEFSAGAWLAGRQFVLSDEWVLENRKFANMELDADDQLLEFAAIVRDDETLKFLFYHCSKILYELNKLYSGSIINWPDFTPLLPEGKAGEMFLLLLAFRAIDKIIEIHETMGIPRKITLDTCADVGSRVLISKEFNHGAIGISNVCLNWLRCNFVAGSIFQIDRLQFHLILFNQPFNIYRNRTSGKYKIIAESNLRVNSDGFLDGIGCKLDPHAWTTIIKTDKELITANIIDDKSGKVIQPPETFSVADWELVINRNSLVMNIHIPRGSRITQEIWLNSINKAFEFFQKYHQPAVELKACVCFSWMFEPRMKKLLPETSGLIALQQLVHLFPLPTTSTTSGLYFVFGTDKLDLDSAPTDNTLRRNIVTHLKAGGVLTGGSMILFKDEIS